jgi:DNA-binding GntR family transcriptional regulator
MGQVAPSKQERVYAQLREKILNGAYGPGFRLVIDRIADEFGVSAVPVREAVRRLEAEGLVLFRTNAGPQVAPADPSLFEETLKVFAVLEGYATGEAAAVLTESQLENLENETDRMVACIEILDVLGFSRANQSFHREIHDHCGNPALQDLLRTIEHRLDAIRRTVFTHIPYRGISSIEDHREIIRLIREGASTSDIETAAREHKLKTVHAFHEWLSARDHGDIETADVENLAKKARGKSAV